MKQRLFIGIELSQPIRDAIAAAIDRLRGRGALPDALRLLAAETWHVTLQFLGDVQDEQLVALAHACAAAAGQHAQFEIELASAGAAPRPRHARVLWLELGRGRDELCRLARAFEAATAPLGFTSDAREFRPHITWARAKPDADARDLLAAFEMPRLAMQVADAVLYRSVRSNSGSRYEVVQRFDLSFAAPWGLM